MYLDVESQEQFGDDYVTTYVASENSVAHTEYGPILISKVVIFYNRVTGAKELYIEEPRVDIPSDRLAKVEERITDLRLIKRYVNSKCKINNASEAEEYYKLEKS